MNVTTGSGLRWQWVRVMAVGDSEDGKGLRLFRHL
jgi:hypothetical protein